MAWNLVVTDEAGKLYYGSYGCYEQAYAYEALCDYWASEYNEPLPEEQNCERTGRTFYDRGDMLLYVDISYKRG